VIGGCKSLHGAQYLLRGGIYLKGGSGSFIGRRIDRRIYLEIGSFGGRGKKM